MQQCANRRGAITLGKHECEISVRVVLADAAYVCADDSQLVSATVGSVWVGV